MMSFCSTTSRRVRAQIISAAFMSVLLGPANADRIVTVMGSRSCADWLSAVQEDSKASILGSGSLQQIGNRTWLSGYVSGLNMGLNTDRNYLQNIDFDTVADWIGQYCESNKDKDLTDAVQVLFAKLGTIGKAKKQPAKDVVPKLSKQKK